MITFILVKRTNDWMVYKKGNKAIWECAETEKGACEKLCVSLGITNDLVTIEREDSND